MKDKWGYGYQETKLQEDVYRVDYEGSEDTNVTTMKDYTLLRCAELTLQKGAKYFAILDTKAETRMSVINVPTAYQRPYPYYLDPYPQNAMTTQTFAEPSLSNTIQIFKERPQNVNALIYDAQKIQENLKAKYKLK